MYEFATFRLRPLRTKPRVATGKGKTDAVGLTLGDAGEVD
jgi:hypothetical protein